MAPQTCGGAVSRLSSEGEALWPVRGARTSGRKTEKA